MIELVDRTKSFRLTTRFWGDSLQWGLGILPEHMGFGIDFWGGILSVGYFILKEDGKFDLPNVDYHFTCKLHNIIFRAAHSFLVILEYWSEPRGGQKHRFPSTSFCYAHSRWLATLHCESVACHMNRAQGWQLVLRKGTADWGLDITCKTRCEHIWSSRLSNGCFS